jgi:hypothetical protein
MEPILEEHFTKGFVLHYEAWSTDSRWPDALEVFQPEGSYRDFCLDTEVQTCPVMLRGDLTASLMAGWAGGRPTKANCTRREACK